MTRPELIASLQVSYPELPLAKLNGIVVQLFASIAEAMGRGDNVELRGFGNFVAQEKPARVARNPQTGEAVDVAPTMAPHFRPSQALKASMHQAYATASSKPRQRAPSKSAKPKVNAGSKSGAGRSGAKAAARGAGSSARGAAKKAGAKWAK